MAQQVLSSSLLNTDDGLSQGMIYDIAQDDEGFLWFATRNGLNRYDGYNFKVFTHNPFDSTSISGDIVRWLHHDSYDRLWVVAENIGLDLYNKYSETFITIDLLKYPIIINNIAEDKDGNIWIGADNSLFKIVTPNPKNSYEVRVEQMTKGDIPEHLLFTSDGELIVSLKEKGLFKWDDNGKTYEPFIKEQSDAFKEVSSIFEYPKGTIWFGYNSVLYRYENKTLTSYTLPAIENSNARLLRICRNPKSNKLWIYFTFHPIIYEIDPQLPPQVSALSPVFEFEEKLYPPKVFFEEDKLLWIGTNGYGIHKSVLQKYPFEYIGAERSVKEMFVNQDGELIYKTNKLIYIHSTNDNEYSILNKLKAQLHRLPEYGYGLLQRADGKYWVVANFIEPNRFVLYLFNKDFNIEKEYNMPNSAMVELSYGQLVEDDNGNLWMASPTLGVIKFDSKKETFTRIVEATVSQLVHLYKDSEGNIWYATLNGLGYIKLDKDSHVKESLFYQNNPKDPQSLNNNSIASVADDPEAPKQYLWVGTKGGGLNKLNKTTGHIEAVFTTQNGLPDNVVYGILPDNDGNLWLSTNRGLSEFSPSTERFVNFRATDGIQDDEFNTASFFKDKKTGVLYFGGINGVTAFQPSEIKQSDYQPKIFLTELRIHNEKIDVGKPLKERGKNPLAKPIEFTDAIRLAWHQNQISLQFAALDFTVSEKNLYQYQLVGVDKDWVISDKNRIANYSNLKVGDYTFRVKGSNSSGAWNEEDIASLKIIIYPPWWATTWAYLCYILALLGLVIYAYRFQINRIKLKNQLAYEKQEAARLAELDKMKSNFFSNITHEFRTPLTLIIEPLRQIIGHANNTTVRDKARLAKANSERLLLLINQLLDLSKLEVEKMEVELKKGNILEVVQPIADSFKILAEQKEIHFQYNAPTSIELFDFDKDKIEKILFNLLSNAIKFTPNGGRVSLTIGTSSKEGSDKMLQLSVVDTGIGISTSQQQLIFNRFYQAENPSSTTKQGTGIGLSLTRELVSLLNGELTLDSEVGKGSTFTISIPMPAKEHTQVLEEYGIEKEIATLATSSILATSPTADLQIPLDASNLALLIEDNDELREFIKTSIDGNYQVITAKNGEEGLQLAFKHLPNIIISDIMMPKMNGYEVCKAIKTNDKTAHIPVILLTAKTALNSKIKGLKYGADAYMNKPFNTQELLVRMENLITIRQKLQEKYSQVVESLAIADPKPNTIDNEQLSVYDQDFLERLHQIVDKHLDDENFSVELLAEQAMISRSQLHRKLKALLNQSPSEFIRTIRLAKGRQLLQKGVGNVTEISFMVGFSSPKYFSTKFKEKYGIKPSEV